jgi:hypothetical protein
MDQRLRQSVRDYLGLGSLDLVDWRFVEQFGVPDGPWAQYDRAQTLRLPANMIGKTRLENVRTLVALVRVGTDEIELVRPLGS